MKIAITGATGFIGRQLVQELANAGVTLLLIGRDQDRLAILFPGHAVSEYAGWEDKAKDFDMLVHLAVENTDSGAGAEDIRTANVDLAVDTAQRAAKASIGRFVLTSSIHALDAARQSPYAETKREAARQIALVEGIESVTVYLPPVYGKEWSGRLGVLNKLPPVVANALFVPLSALTPTLHVSKLSRFVLDGAPAGADDMPILTDDQNGNWMYRLSKRLLDLAVAIVLLGFFWWLMALIAIAIRFDTPGNPFFAQRRVGKNGRPFTLYKFRTMHTGTKQAGTHEVSSGAVTGLGLFLRRTKLDELPQAWNLLINQMSLVGPRPCLPSQTDLIEARNARGVLRLKPGITGLAQVNGIDMSDPVTLARWDARYVALRSLLLDIKLMIRTVLGGGQGDRTRSE